MGDSVQIGGTSVPPGTRARLELPVARLPTETWLSLPIEVVNGRHPGPRLWMSAAIHGDEINGVEIIRQVLSKLDARRLRGSIIAAPIVNVFGFISQSRYLPDRRDLNRCFPGSPRGSMASRLSHLFMTEVVRQSTHGIDLHTGSNHRTNLPQIRADLSDPETRRCAKAFAAPVMIHSETRDGSLRQAALIEGLHALVYEGGEPLRFDPEAIELGVAGICRVLEELGMQKLRPKHKAGPSVEVAHGTWIRARRSGILRLDVRLGQEVRRNQPLGIVADAFGDNGAAVTAPCFGLVIGHTNNPLVSQGDALVHLAEPVPREP